MITLINFFTYDKEEDKIVHLIQGLGLMEKTNEIYFENVKKYFSKVKNVISKDSLPSTNDFFITKHTNNNFNLVLNSFLKINDSFPIV